MSRLRLSAFALVFASGASGADDWTPGRASALLASPPAKAFADRARGSQAAATANPWPEVIETAKKATVRIGTDSSWGSGFIVRPDGLVVTNAHVVSDVKIGSSLKVLVESTELDAKLVASGSQNCRDLALIQLSGRADWATLTLNETQPRLGEEVLALGYPSGPKDPKGSNPLTVTRGVVSGLDRVHDKSECDHYIQMDASVNSANSGGPLITADGAVVGVNTWGFEGTQQLNFAIRAADVKKALAQYDRVKHLSEGSLGLAVGFDEKRKRLVARQVYSGRAAARAGVYQGDVLAAYGGSPPGEDPQAVEAFIRWVRGLVPGDTAAITISRGGVARQISIVVEKLDATPPQRLAELGLGNPKS